jgi:hypothetical protein
VAAVAASVAELAASAHPLITIGDTDFEWDGTSFDHEGNHQVTYECMTCGETVKDLVIHIELSFRRHLRSHESPVTVKEVIEG